jgi:hypothetical protein
MVKKYPYGTFPSQDRKFVENIGASKTSTGNQMVIEFLEEWKIKNPGKKLDTFTLNEVMARAYPDYKGTPAKKASDLMTSNPAWWEKASEGIEIEYTLRGKGTANEAYKNDPEFKKYYDENYKKPWDKLTVDERSTKNTALKKFEIEKQRRKVIPIEALTEAEFADEIGMKQSTFNTIRSANRFKKFRKQLENIFGKPYIFKSGGYSEVRYTPPTEEGIEKLNDLLAERKNASIAKMVETINKPFNQAIKDVHKVLKENPELVKQGNLEELAQQIYGDAEGKTKLARDIDLEKKMRMVAGDVTRYSEFLLDPYNTRNVKGIKIPQAALVDSLISDIATNTQIGKYGAGAIREKRMRIIDGILRTKGTKFRTARNKVVKHIQEGKHLDEVAAIGAVYKNAPGYAGFGQEISAEKNLRKASQIDRPFTNLLAKVVSGNTKGPVTFQNQEYATVEQAIKAFNKSSKNFAKEQQIITPQILFTPGEKLDVNDFLPEFSKLGPEAQQNVRELAERGIGIDVGGAKPLNYLAKFSNQEIKKFLLNKAEEGGPVCSIFGMQSGGVAGGSCRKQMELAFDTAPEKTLNDIGKLNDPKLKTFAQRALSLLPKLGTVGKIGTVVAGAGIALSGLRYNPEKGEIVTTDNDQKADQNQILQYVKDNPLKVTAGSSLGFAAQEVPGAYKAARDLGRGKVRSTLGISGAIRPVLTTFGTPLLTGLYEGAIGAKRLEEGETMTDVLTDPLGPALGISLMEPLSKMSGVVRDAKPVGILGGLKRAFNPFDMSNVGTARPGLTSKILRMGMSPRVIAGISRLGPYGMVAGAGLAALDQYNKYQNQEGMIYNLFNN